VLRWLKAVGERVVLNEPLIELETDKVTVEVAAPGSGVLREILKREQDDVAPGELLGRIEMAGTGSVAASAEITATGAGAGGPTAATKSATATLSTPPSGTSQSAALVKAPAAHLLSPAVRRLLAEHALDVSSIVGSGEGGRVTVQDVLRAADERGTDVAPVDDGGGRGTDVARVDHGDGRVPDVAPVDDGDGRAPADVEPARRVPHSAVRKRIAEHMTRSLLHTAPHVTTVFEADMSAVLRHRAKHRDSYASHGIPLTLTAYFLQACVPAIRAVPEVNSRWLPAALETFDSMHIGIATALENELVVPVLRGVESLDLRETARQLRDLTRRAREHRLTPADVRGGTFTISNHGVSGSLLATPIVINQPQSAILGIGKLEKRVVVEDTQEREDHLRVERTREREERLLVQPRCYITLTIDHRVLDGHRANQFLQTFVAHLAAWPES
jgi:2-oxoglutarate dehydrogenase E2 component (dihydrolipoamide succinyltransferase)